jgi:Na+-driven multidrug efflux pump
MDPIIFQAVFALVFLALMAGATFYGIWRAYRTERSGWLAGIVGAWLLGVGWIVGLVFLLGPDRKYRQGVRAAASGQGYHPDYKRLGT